MGAGQESEEISGAKKMASLWDCKVLVDGVGRLEDWSL
jgi:hypothetical protein